MQERFSQAQLAEIRTMSYRAANRKFGIGYSTWKKVKLDKDFVPSNSRRGDREIQEVEERVLESVREIPHVNTQVRAINLGLRVQTCQKVLTRHGLGHLNERLRFAGYQVDVLRPLEVARQRRIVAAYPGALTHIDFKTFGLLRGHDGQAAKRLSGHCVVDSLTGFATLHLGPSTGENAVYALQKHKSTAPFRIKGIVFSDNGRDFLSNQFIRFVIKAGWIQRTTRYNSPWSNGKVEALNKTLKYQCFPALIAANVTEYQAVVRNVEEWIRWYNTTRAHRGWINKGLPPQIWYDLWRKTKGDHVDKLVALGILPVDNSWHVSMMGSDRGNAGERPWGPGNRSNGSPRKGLPFAFVLDKSRPDFLPKEGAALPGFLATKRKSPITLAK